MTLFQPKRPSERGELAINTGLKPGLWVPAIAEFRSVTAVATWDFAAKSRRFNLAGPVLAVRPYCNNQHYWQVYFDTNRLIRETFAQAGYPVPDQHYTVKDAEPLRLAQSA